MLGRISAAFALAAALAGPAAAQTAVPSGPPPSWESLIPCAQTSDPAEGFRCYQAAMKAAGYTPNPAAVAADRRRRFGLSLPSLHRRPREPAAEASAAGRPKTAKANPAPAPAAEEARDDRIVATLDQVALLPPLNRLLLVTTDGAVWQQTDNQIVAPLPRSGQTMTVLRGKIDGFFCQFDKRTRVRCKRTH